MKGSKPFRQSDVVNLYRCIEECVIFLPELGWWFLGFLWVSDQMGCVCLSLVSRDLPVGHMCADLAHKLVLFLVILFLNEPGSL